MKRTLILSLDSCEYYYIILENGEKVRQGSFGWHEFENDADALISRLKEENGELDYIYWI